MSNLTQRVLTAAVAIPLILFLCIQGGVFFLAFIMLISSVALWEFYGLCGLKGAVPQRLAGVIAGISITLSFYHQNLQNGLAAFFLSMGIPIGFPSQSQLLMIVFLVSLVVLSLIELFRQQGSPMLNLATTVLGLMYVSCFLGTFVGIREMFSKLDPPVAGHFMLATATEDPAVIYRYGGYTVISIFAMIWICDSAAFHFGKAMGKHKLFPRVSPNKSWEGAIWGFVFALGSAVAAKYILLDY